MQRGPVYFLILGCILLIFAAINIFTLPMTPKNLMLDAACAVLGAGRLLRFFLPVSAAVGPLRILGIVLLVAYFGMKASM